MRIDRNNATQARGRLQALDADTFTLLVDHQKDPLIVPYAEVTRVRGGGLSHGAKVGIIVGVCVVAAIGIAAIVIDHKVESGFPKTIPI